MTHKKRQKTCSANKQVQIVKTNPLLQTFTCRDRIKLRRDLHRSQHIDIQSFWSRLSVAPFRND